MAPAPESAPAPGVEPGARLHLGVLQTDHVGYVSFLFPPAIISGLLVGVVGSSEAPQEIADFGA